MARRHRNALLLPLVAVVASLATACGSTVQVTSHGTVQDALAGSDGLSPATAPSQGSSATGPAALADPGNGALPAPPGPGGGAPPTSGRSTRAPHAGTSTAPSAAAPPVAASAPRITTPIQIGFLAAASNAAANAALGSSGGTSETPQEAMAYFVSQLNARGGLAGRRINVVQSFIDPTSSDYESQASAACANFTQDHHVAAVFSVESSYYSENFTSCLNRVHVPELLALVGGTDRATLAKYPYLVSPTAPTVERRFTALIKGLSGNGFLSKSNVIGVVVEDCPYNQRVYTSTIGPMLAARGFTVKRRDVSCVHGFADAASYIAAIQSEVLPFNSAKVDRVVFVTGFEQIAANYFEQQAKSQHYAPKYALTSTSDAGDNTMDFSAEALSRVQGVGWQPDLDVTKLVTGTAATQRCRTLWRGFAPAAARQNRQNNEVTCEEFFTLEAALLRTRGHSDATTLMAGLLGLGTSYSSPLSLGGSTDYGTGRKDGPELFATFGFSKGCSCLAYTSAPARLA